MESAEHFSVFIGILKVLYLNDFNSSLYLSYIGLYRSLEKVSGN